MKYLKSFICLMAVVLMFSWAAVGDAEEILIGFTGPLSGPAAEYGQDCVNGIEMAVKDINAAGGIKVKGASYLFKLEKLDDRVDPTLAVNNARRFRSNGAVAIFSPVFNCIAPLMKINEENGNEFLLMGYTSTPKATQLGNKLAVLIPPPFTIYNSSFADMAWQQGWRKAAMLVTLGAYGDENRAFFKTYWEKLGGTITIDKPANYYTETDFSSQLAAVLATKPDVMFIGGPSAPTALVVEQARTMGFKGGFIFIDQARADYVASILKNNKLLENTISVAAVDSIPFSSSVAFNKRYSSTHKRISNMEAIQNYMAMRALARAIVASGAVNNIAAIRASFPKAFPMLGDQFPTEAHGITSDGRMEIFPYVQMVKDGKPTRPAVYAWWPKTQQEFNQVKKITKSTSHLIWKKAE
jgi:branched-chain amino acid transport system substrate-binding protein